MKGQWVILSMPDWNIDNANTDLLDCIEAEMPPIPLSHLPPSPTVVKEDSKLWGRNEPDWESKDSTDPGWLLAISTPPQHWDRHFGGTEYFNTEPNWPEPYKYRCQGGQGRNTSNPSKSPVEQLYNHSATRIPTTETTTLPPNKLWLDCYMNCIHQPLQTIPWLWIDFCWFLADEKISSNTY